MGARHCQIYTMEIMRAALGQHIRQTMDVYLISACHSSPGAEAFSLTAHLQSLNTLTVIIAANTAHSF